MPSFSAECSEWRLPQTSWLVALRSRCDLTYFRHRFRSRLHHAELLERFLRTHSVLDGPLHQTLLLHLLQSPAEHLLFSSARDHAYSIKIAKDDVSRHHPCPTDFQRHSEVYNLPARRLILGVSSVGEGGKTKLEDPARVAVVAVDDRSGGPELYGSRAHQLTPKGIPWRGASTDVDLSSLQVVERPEHQAEGLGHEVGCSGAMCLHENVGLQHRHGPSDDHHIVVERFDLRRQKLA